MAASSSALYLVKDVRRMENVATIRVLDIWSGNRHRASRGPTSGLTTGRELRMVRLEFAPIRIHSARHFPGPLVRPSEKGHVLRPIGIDEQQLDVMKISTRSPRRERLFRRGLLERDERVEGSVWERKPIA